MLENTRGEQYPRRASRAFPRSPTPRALYILLSCLTCMLQSLKNFLVSGLNKNKCFQMMSYIFRKLELLLLFLVCNHVTRRPCWWSIQRNFSAKIASKYSSFPSGEKCFCFAHQHGRRDVTCQPAITIITQSRRPPKWNNSDQERMIKYVVILSLSHAGFIESQPRKCKIFPATQPLVHHGVMVAERKTGKTKTKI